MFFIQATVTGSVHGGVKSWGLLFLLSVCLLFCRCKIKTTALSWTSESGKRRRFGAGGGWALGEEQLNKQSVERETGGERNPEFFSCVRHVIWANPLIWGRWLFGPLGCWVSVTDEKKRGWFDWNLRPTSCQKWTILRERAEFWIYFDMVIWLAERHQKDP